MDPEVQVSKVSFYLKELVVNTMHVLKAFGHLLVWYCPRTLVYVNRHMLHNLLVLESPIQILLLWFSPFSL